MELEFLTDDNSNINIQQIEKIELEIKKNIRIYISPEAEKYVRGTNFIATDVTIWLRDVLNLQKK